MVALKLKEVGMVCLMLCKLCCSTDSFNQTLSKKKGTELVMIREKMVASNKMELSLMTSFTVMGLFQWNTLSLQV